MTRYSSKWILNIDKKKSWNKKCWVIKKERISNLEDQMILCSLPSLPPFFNWLAMMTFVIIVLLIPFIPENVAVTCQTSNILVAIQKSLFTDSDPSFAATDLALHDKDCKATNGSITFDFDITLGTCNTELTISKDEERSFYHNVVFDIKKDPDEAEFNIICSYVRTPTTASSE